MNNGPKGPAAPQVVKIPIALIDHAEGFLVHSQYENPKHPPDKEYCDDSSRDVN